MTFYVTPLDPTTPLVLGHSWLTRYNPSIDWATSCVSFPSEIPDSICPSEASVPTPVEATCQLQERQSSLQPPSVSLLSISESVTLPSEYADYADVFDKGKADRLPPHRSFDLKITLDGPQPPPSHLYSMSASEQESLRAFLDENIANGIICPSTSPLGAPVLFVKKKDGSLRLCVDFRALNKVTKKDRYSLPWISDLLDAPSRASVYTKLDLRHAYHLVRIAEGDEWKTAFRTRYGSFEWLVMPFGLTNAPAAFQRFINSVFSDLLDVCVIVYLDDVLIFSDSLAQHHKHVREVLRCLRANGLYANLGKCDFHLTSVEYLGYIISPIGLTMAPSKVQTILDWPEPRKVKDIQSFLGFANFYRRFIHNYSDIVVPLTRLTRKDVPWDFSDSCKAAFEHLKSCFVSAPVLTRWVPGAPLIVETDASDYAITAILSTKTSDDEIHLIAFYS